jgi:hypothetical protein
LKPNKQLLVEFQNKFSADSINNSPPIFLTLRSKFQIKLPSFPLL